ncbi:MAG: histidine ammonia-lyase [Bacillota bacterium]
MDNHHCIIRGEGLTIKELVAVARHGVKVSLAPEAKERVLKSRAAVERLISDRQVAYGITTGFGKFSDVLISPEETKQLQKNLIMSHAVGVGDPFPEEVVRAMILLRANALAKGFSGIRLETLQALISLLNAGVHPFIPEKGSLGASGDLAPLSHLVLVLMGMGEAFYQGQRMPGGQALAAAGLSAVELEGKEGLALINGTQAMTAVGALAVHDAEQLVKVADLSGALTMEALQGLIAAFDARVHELRPHSGQQQAASNVRTLVNGSNLIAGPQAPRVQDAYALRCMAQVHGASRDAIAYVRRVVETELNSVTDNPLIFADTGEVISGGNFHGQPVALAMDFLGIALSELANISERRLERLVNPSLSGLPAFLTTKGGLNSGFMIVQYSAAALVSENKVLAHPASVDSIPSSANQEDHVSMGTIAARKARSILDNASHVIAMEILAACQGIDLRGEGQLGQGTEPAYRLVREHVEALAEDRVMYGDIQAVTQLVKSGRLLQAVEAKVELK